MPDANGTRDDELLTVEEIANQLKLHPQTIRTWIRTGRLPAKKYGRVYRLRRTDVDTVLNADEGEGSIGANRDLFIARDAQRALPAPRRAPIRLGSQHASPGQRIRTQRTPEGRRAESYARRRARALRGEAPLAAASSAATAAASSSTIAAESS